MRKIKESQMKIGEVDVSKIEFDLRCRDEIPKLLMGLQYLYCTPHLRAQVFAILQELIPAGVDPDRGRYGMELWKILVLGTLRLNCNWDYDKLQDIANNHATLRLMLGHGYEDEKYYYALQTLKDNVSLLTPDILDKINQVVVRSGHQLVKKKEEKLRGRCDSFVVETDVHYPTDINLLYDAIRKVMTLFGNLCHKHGLTSWRQWRYHVRKIRTLYRHAQKVTHSTSSNPQKKAQRGEEIKRVHQCYIDLVESYFRDVQGSFVLFRSLDLGTMFALREIDYYLRFGNRLLDLVRRRVINGEKIPHHEKIFSIFEPHTEWICKGKAGVPQELGLRVSIVEDQYGFILHHRVMVQQTDQEVAVELIRETKERFTRLVSCSFDKGFWSPHNKEALREYLSVVAVRKKGRRTQHDAETEQGPAFKTAYQGHPAVESGINALENHGLDRCLDHGLNGFKRYVSLAVVARNIQRLGHHLQGKEYSRRKRKEKIQATLHAKRLVHAA